MKILALIPARSGDKGVTHKNIRLFGGKPLLAHSIEHARSSHLINRIIVSTDSPHYAEIALRYGADTPFLRPIDITQDLSTDLEVFQHALSWLKENENYIPDICVHLRPTCPLRKINDIDEVIRILINHPDIDSVRSISPAPETPFKMWFHNENSLISPVVKTDTRDTCNLPRQILPAAYLQNDSIDAVRSRVITDLGSMTGKKIYGYLMEKNYNIDTEDEFQNALAELSTNKNKKNNHPLQHTAPVKNIKTFCIDIDGVIAMLEPDNQYDRTVPIRQAVEAINTLYDKGHRIILFTARGSLTGIDWRDTTKTQMDKWGVKYHELLFGKPAADYYVDDKALLPESLYIMASENIQDISRPEGSQRR